MSQTIDDKVVEMRFDNRDFETNVQTSLSTIDKLKNSLNFEGATKGLENIDSAAKKVDMASLGDSVEAVKVKFSALEVVGMTALSNLTTSAMNAGKQFIKSLSIDNIAAGWDKFESKTQNVGTLLAQGFSESEIYSQLDELSWFTDETSFRINDMTQSITQFTAAGLGLEDSVSAMEGIANWASLSGQNVETASRAMYQLSEAIASGYMRQEDYRSIKTASMNTAEFQQKCVDAAVAMGTLKENSDGTYSSLVEGAKNASFTVEGFTSELTTGMWLTRDVMMEVFKDYAGAVDDIYEYVDENDVLASQAIEALGDDLDEFQKKAFEASQQARSWSDVVDSTKEAVSSQWSNMFEMIFGSFDEAVELWTDLCEYLYDIFAAPIEGLNKLLKPALTSGWDDFKDEITSAGVSMKDFKKTTKEVAREHNIDVDTMIEEEGSFADSLQRGWMTSDIVSESLERLAGNASVTGEATEDLTKKVKEYSNLVDKVINGDYGNGEDRVKALTDAGYEYADVQALVNKVIEGGEVEISDLSDAELENLGYTEDEIDAIHALAEEAKNTGTEFSDLIEQVSRPSGRDLFVDALMNSIEALMQIIDIFKEAWNDVFGVTSNQIYNIIKSIDDFTKGLKLSDESAENLKNALEGLFSVLYAIGDAVWSVAKVGFTALGKVLGAILPVALNVAGALGQIITTLVNCTVKSENFRNGFKNVISTMGSAIKSFGSWVYNLLNVNGVLDDVCKMFSDFVANVKNLDFSSMDGIIGLFTSFGSTVSGAIKRILKEIYNLPIVQNILQGFCKLLGISMEDLENFFKNGWQAIKNFFSGIKGMSLKDFGDSIVHALTHPKELLNSFLKVLTTFGKGVGTVFGALFSIIPKIGKFFSNLIGGFKSSGNAIGGAFETIKNVFSNGLDAIKKLFSNFDLKTLISSAFSGALIYVLYEFGKFGGQLSNLSESITGMFNNISKLLKAAKMKMYAESIKIFAEAIAILAVSILLLAQLPTDKLIISAGVIVGLGAALVALMKYVMQVGKMTIKMDFAKTAAGIAAIGIAILLLAEALKVVSSISVGDLVKGVVALSVMMFVLVEAMKVLGKQCTSFSQVSGSSMTSSKTSFIQIGIGMMAMAAAMYILVKALKQMEDLNVEDIVEQLIVVLGVMLSLSVMSRIAGGGSFSSGLGMILMVESLNLLIKVLGNIANMDMQSIWNNVDALILIMGVMLTLSIMMRIAGKNGASAGVGMLLMGASIAILCQSIATLSKLDSGGLGRGLAVVIVLEAMFAVLIGITKLAGKDAARIGIVLMEISAAIAILAVVIALLSILDPQGVLIGTAAIVGLEVCIAVLMAVTKGVDEKAVSALKVLLGIIVAIGAVITVLSILDVNGVIAGTVAVSALMAMSAILMKFGDTIKDTKKLAANLFVMVGVIGSLTAVLALMSLIPAESAIASAISLSTVLTAMTASLAIISKLKISSISSIAKNLFMMVAVMTTLGLVLDMLVMLSPDSALDTALSLTVTILAMSVALGVLSKLGVSATSGITAALALGEFIGILSGVLIALGGIAQIPGVNWLVDEGSAFLNKIGEAIGSFVGSIASGFMTAATADLATVGDNLSAFMDSVQPFLDSAQNIDSSVLDGTKTICKAVMNLVNTDFKTQVMSFFSGGNNMEHLGDQLTAFVWPLIRFVNSMESVDPETLKNSTKALKFVGEFAGALPKEGGIFQKWTGSSDMGAFGQQLEDLGPHLATFAGSVEGLSSESIENATSAAKMITEFAKTIPNQGGKLAEFLGDNTMDVFGAQLPQFGTDLSDFAKNIKDLSKDDIENATSAATMVSEFAKTIPNQGGKLAEFLGDNTMDVFGAQLPQFGKNLSSFAESIHDLDKKDIKKATSAATLISEFAKSIPNQGGALAALVGDNTLESFGNQLPGFGVNLLIFSTEMKGVDSAAITNSVIAAEFISMFANSIPEPTIFDRLNPLGGSAFQNFYEQLPKFGRKMVKYYDAVSQVSDWSPVTNSTIAARGLANIAKSFYDADKSALEIFKGSGFGNFIDKLGIFGNGIKDYYDAVKEIDNFQKIQNSAPAAQALAEIAQSFYGVDKSSMEIVFGSGFGQFASNLGVLGDGMKSYVDAIEGVDDFERVKNSVPAAEGLADIALAFGEENMGFFEKSSFSNFVKNLSDFGDGMGAYYEAVKDVENWDPVTNSIEAAEGLAAIAQSFRNTDKSWLDVFTSDGFAEFVNHLKPFGQGVYDYWDAVKSIRSFGQITLSAEAAEGLAEIAKSFMYADKSWLDIFASDGFANFVNELKPFGEGMAGYYEQISTIDDWDQINSSIEGAQGLAGIAQVCREVDFGIFEKDGFKSFVGAIPTLGENMLEFYNHISGVDSWTDISTCITTLWRILDFVSSSDFENINVDNFTDQIKSLGEAAEEVSGIDMEGFVDFASKGAEAMSSFVDGFSGTAEDVIAAMSGIISTMHISLLEDDEEFCRDAILIMNQFLRGIDQKKDEPSKAFAEMAESANETIQGYEAKFRASGYNLSKGFADGIRKGTNGVKDAAKSVAQSALDEVNATIDANSPSKESEKTGRWFDEGLANGIWGWANVVTESVSDVGEAAMSTLSNTLSALNFSDLGDLDLEPTISPVVDLSNVEAGANEINRLFSSGQSISVDTTSAYMASSSMRSMPNENTEDRLLSAMKGLRSDLASRSSNVYNVNGVTYDDGSNVADAVGQLVRVAKIERRV